MDEWRVFLETLAGNPAFWGVCMHVAQEARHYYDKWREEKGEPAPGYDRGMTGFLDATGAWHGWIGRVAAETIRELPQDVAEGLDAGEASRRKAALVDAMARITRTERVEEMVGEEIRGAGDMEAGEVRRAAELIVGRIASDEALCRRLTWNTVEEVKLLARGEVRVEDLRGTMDSLRALVCERVFFDEYVRERQATERECAAFVDPPVSIEGEEYGSFGVGQLAAMLEDRWTTRLALTGPAGIGKTRLTRELTQSLAAREEPPVALYVPPWEYQDWKGLNDVIDWLLESGLRAHGSLNERKVVRMALHRYRDEVIFVLDGLDQARGEEGGVDALLTGPLALSRVLVAGRTEGFERIRRAAHAYRFPTVEMRRFDEEHVRAFVEGSVLAERPRYAERALGDAGREDRTYDTPLMLSLLCEVAEDPAEGAYGPVSELGLLAQYIDRMEERGSRQCADRYREHFGAGRGPGVQWIWERLAYEAFAWRSGGEARPQVQHLEREFLSSTELEEALTEEVGAREPGKRDFALQCGLLGLGDRHVLEQTDGYRRAGREPKGAGAFIHLVIQEYLAARALVRRLADGKFAPLRGIRSLSDPGWDAVRFGDLEELARPKLTPNAARLLAGLIEDGACPVEVGDPAWVDALLDWILSEDSELVRQSPDKVPGLGERAEVKRRNALRSNLLHTAMSVRDVRYEESLERARGGEEPGEYEAHAFLEDLWEDQRAASRARQREFLEQRADRIAEMRENWSPVLGEFEDWAVLPAGPSVIGSWEYEDEQPIRKLRFPLAPDAGLLLIGRHPVTNAEYERFRPDHDADQTDREEPGWDRRPVVNVTSQDARDYCEWLGERAGGTVRLPGELEWEWACRAGTTTNYCFGNDEARLGEYAWYFKNASNANLVGEKKPNPWGLRDVHGNVEEWCGDWFDEDAYDLDPTAKPAPPAEEKRRVVRGGAWDDSSGFCRGSDRDWYDPSSTSSDVGFRVVCLSPRP